MLTNPKGVFFRIGRLNSGGVTERCFRSIGGESGGRCGNSLSLAIEDGLFGNALGDGTVISPGPTLIGFPLEGFPIGGLLRFRGEKGRS